MATKRNLLIQEIKDAFSGVELEDGISMMQAAGMDTYSNREICAVGTNEVVNNWQNLPADELVGTIKLAYFDPKGFRYYFPAYALWSLQQLEYFEQIHALEYINFSRVQSIVGSLILGNQKELSEYKSWQFSMFSLAQCVAVAHYLMFMVEWCDVHDERYPSMYAKQALEEYWDRFLQIPM